MTGVIVMAGGKCKSSLVENMRDFVAYPFMKLSEWIGGYSFEVPIRGYKPAKRVKNELEGVVKERPMITYVIHRLCNTSNIEDIVVVGERKILENILERNLPAESYERFKLIGRIVQQAGSFRENGLQGYRNLSKNTLEASNDYALFMFGDSVNCTSGGMEKFINRSREMDADIIFGVATEKQLESFKRYFPRPPLDLIDDISFSESDRDEKGIVGLRSADRIYANPTKIKNLDVIDEIYKFRRVAKNLMHPRKSAELRKRIGISLKKYFAKKLTLSEVLEKASNELGAKISILKVEDAASSLDLDAERDIPASERMNHDLMLEEQKR